MKSIAKIVCCGVALAWMYSATAEEEAVGQTAEDEVTDSTSAAAPENGSAMPTRGSSRVLTPMTGRGTSSASAGGTTNATSNASDGDEAPAAGGEATNSVLTAPAEVATPSTAAPDDVVVPTPPAPRIAVKPYHDKVDRANVEKRLDDKSARTKKRSAEAEKDVAERAKAQQGQANAVQK